MTEPTIRIPYGDWLQEWEKSSVKPKTQEDILQVLQETQRKPSEMARLAIVSREQGEADDDILKPNKITLMLGGAQQISAMIARRKVNVKVANKTFAARQYVAHAREEQSIDAASPEEKTEYQATLPAIATSSHVASEDIGPTLVEAQDPLAEERARKYLFHTVTGFIWNRLLIIATNKGDVQAAADRLKREIDDMVARLT